MRQIFVLPLALLLVASLNACVSGKSGESGGEVKDGDAPKAIPVAELKINDLTAGQGDAAQAGDTVLVNYTGWLYEGGKKTTQFDSSINPGREPFEMTIGKTSVIRGWTQGL